ncbi:MFS transporter [Bacillus sonorensis]|uniref:D-galactonate transporter DgoT n=2 Tax=Bacillus sonorensis TaxID=119858 RepID=M5P2G4_9BACI|nr:MULTISPECIES: MFS transporter [Bacillus]TWK80855.1 D-galactonate transporter [Bacillus paralicheniformis]ASB86879.1 Inner membrane transport protein RhmT [Bacillus sonorensis]EME73629.1 D-galactonate transporter DgoT [Bacillus sonorensis L12]MBG9914594.1 glucarate transporter [Bacillus sonorensis]MCF7616132.1 MFS transporter [Bacillus sonorensis]
MKAVNQNQKPTKVRVRVLLFIFVCVVINYMDRSNISVAASKLGDDLNLSSVQLGLIFSAFGWAYCALQIPGGGLVDRFGPRLVYGFTLITWSIATLLQGFARGFGSLFGLRLATGAFEAPAFPANNRVVTSWFPEQERASAIAFYTSGQFAGLAFLTPALSAVQHVVGWRGLFIVTGAIGIIWGIIWYVFYRDPDRHPKVNKAELEHIEKGGGIVRREQGLKKEKTAFNWTHFKQVTSHRKLWGIYIGQFAVNSTLWFFLTWFPTYLVKYRGLDFLQSGFLASLPFLAAFVGVLLSGFLSDFLVKRGVSAGVARKTPIIIGLFLSISIIGANYVNQTSLIILFMTLAFFGNGLASITWVLVSSLAPKHLIGLTGGVFNFVGSLASVIVPIVIGFLADGGSFAPALVFIGILALLGALSYIFLVGKVERIHIKHETKEKHNISM